MARSSKAMKLGLLAVALMLVKAALGPAFTNSRAVQRPGQSQLGKGSSGVAPRLQAESPGAAPTFANVTEALVWGEEQWSSLERIGTDAFQLAMTYLNLLQPVNSAIKTQDLQEVGEVLEEVISSSELMVPRIELLRDLVEAQMEDLEPVVQAAFLNQDTSPFEQGVKIQERTLNCRNMVTQVKGAVDAIKSTLKSIESLKNQRVDEIIGRRPGLQGTSHVLEMRKLSTGVQKMVQASNAFIAVNNRVDDAVQAMMAWSLCRKAGGFPMGDPLRRLTWEPLVLDWTEKEKAFEKKGGVSTRVEVFQAMRRGYQQLFIAEIRKRLASGSDAESDEEFCREALTAGVPSPELKPLRERIRLKELQKKVDEALRNADCPVEKLDAIAGELGLASADDIPVEQRVAVHTRRVEKKLHLALQQRDYLKVETAFKVAEEKQVQVDRALNSSAQSLRLAHYAESDPEKVWEILPLVLVNGGGRDVVKSVVTAARAAISSMSAEKLQKASEGLARLITAHSDEHLQRVLAEVQLAICSTQLKQGMRTQVGGDLEKALTLCHDAMSVAESYPGLALFTRTIAEESREAKLLLFKATLLDWFKNQKHKAEEEVRNALDALPALPFRKPGEVLSPWYLEEVSEQPELHDLHKAVKEALALGSSSPVLWEAEERLRWRVAAAALTFLLPPHELKPKDIPGPITDYILHQEGVLPDEGRLAEMHAGKRKDMLKHLEALKEQDPSSDELMRSVVQSAHELTSPLSVEKDSVQLFLPATPAELGDDEVLELVEQLGEGGLRSEMLRWGLPTGREADLAQMREALISHFISLTV